MSSQVSVFSQVAEWMFAEQGVGVEICTDLFNNSFACGQFVGDVEIGAFSFTSLGVQDGVVVKTDPNGNILWASPFGGTGGDYCNEIVFDNWNSLWVTGQFSGTMYAGDFTLVSAGGTDAFLVKLDAASGEIVFAERFGSSGNDVGMGIKADIFGDVYVSGTYIGNLSFGNILLSGQGQHDIFLIKVDIEGMPVWGSSIKGSSFDASWSMAIDSDRNTYIAGFSTSSSPNFAGTVLNFAETTHFIAKFDLNGAYVWTALSEFNGEVYGLCADADNNVYFTGNYDTQGTFGNIQLTGVGLDEVLLGKINSDGGYEWVNSYGGSGNDEGYDVECKPDGELYLIGTFEGSFTFGDVNISTEGFAKTYVANIDSDGDIIWVIQSYGPAATSHISKSIAHNSNGELFINGNGNTSISIGGLTTAIAGSYLVKLLDDANIIQGVVYRDTNNDGVKDIGESGIPNVILQLDQGPGVSSSNNAGVFEVFAGTGAHEVSIPNLPLYHTLTTPDVQSANFVGLGNMDADNDFGLFPTPGISDLRIDITPVSSPKAGFVLAYMLTYTNVGTEAIDATIDLVSDADISYLSASPEPDFQSGQNSSWNLGVLEPQISGTMYVLFNIPMNMNIGDTIASEVSISPLVSDVTPLDNTMQTSSEVTGPYDPNSKEVSANTLYNIVAEDWLSYTIHFQNIGNDSAHTVIVIDTLSHQLNLSSMEILASSHQPMNFSISGGHVAEFRYDNIMLPDSATDPIGSMGFVKFRVKYLQTIPYNDSIVNFADIYFDYNLPIRTNSAITHHLDGTIGINSNASVQSFELYPNPSVDQISFNLNQKINAGALINIFDLNGKLVLSEVIQNPSIGIYTVDVSPLQVGMYLLEVLDGDNVLHSNFVKQ